MKMKTLGFLTFLLAGFGTAANAYTINSGAIDVGVEDTLLAIEELANSSEETERLWVESIVGGPITYSTKEEDVSYTIVDQGGTIGAFELQTGADYFLVKDGKIGQANEDAQHALFQNNASLDWGVVDFFAIFGSNWNGELVISHVSEFNGRVEVTEPGTIALFATALTGLLIARRRKTASA